MSREIDQILNDFCSTLQVIENLSALQVILWSLKCSLLRSRYEGRHAKILPTKGCSLELCIPFPQIDQ